jgi:hypothetical protein
MSGLAETVRLVPLIVSVTFCASLILAYLSTSVACPKCSQQKERLHLETRRTGIAYAVSFPSTGGIVVSGNTLGPYVQRLLAMSRGLGQDRSENVLFRSCQQLSASSQQYTTGGRALSISHATRRSTRDSLEDEQEVMVARSGVLPSVCLASPGCFRNNLESGLTRNGLAGYPRW